MVQIDPLYVNFSMPSRQFEKLAAGFMSGQIVLGSDDKQLLKPEEYRKLTASQAPVYVEAVLPNGSLYSERGKIVFFDSSENTQTSSLAIKAEFANPKKSRALMPGQFVRVHLVGAIYKNAILIPSSAVLNSAQGKIAYVIDANNMVAARPIQAELQDDMYIVSDGLKAGEKVVSDGLIRLRPGMQVTAQMQKFMPVQPAPAASQPTTEGDVAKLEAAIESAEAPDEQALPQDAAQAKEVQSADNAQTGK